MLSEEQKLEEFIAAVGRLYPKQEVTYPMNTRHSDEFLFFEEGIELGLSKNPPVVKEKTSDFLLSVHSRITKHFSGELAAETLVMYTDQEDYIVKLRKCKTMSLRCNVYYDESPVFTDTASARAYLKDVLKFS